MYDIKLGQGCGIKATMLTPAGGVCDLRRARYIAASLVLVSGATMNCEDVTFNEVTNAVYVRLLGTRELTATGRYGIIFNVKLEDKTMYSTPVVWFAEVKENAPTGYHELTLSLSLTVVNFPDNVSYTGASPKIGDKNTWLVYDDNLNAYVDTGIEVGYANLLSRYDDVINTLAHSDCTLDERVEALEKALIAVLSGAVVIPKLQIKELNVWGNNSLAPVGDGAPTKAPDRAGQFYIDKTARALYFSTGNAAVSDWKIQ